MKALIVFMLCACSVCCNIASAQQPFYGAAGGGGVAAYPPYPPYPPPVYPQQQQFPFPFPGGHSGGDPSRSYESALISLLAIQNVLTQQTEVQRGWNDRANDKLNILLNQQEFYRQTYGRDQQFLAQQLCGLQHFQQPIPYPAPRPYPVPQPRRGLFRRGASASIAVGGDAYYGGGY